MFKILSWFIGLILIFFIFYYGLKYGSEIFTNSTSWFQNANQGNQDFLKQMQDPNGMFQDNSASNSVPSFLDRWFPGIFPLIKVPKENTNNTSGYYLNPETTYGSNVPEEVKTYVEDGNLQEIVKEVNFGNK
jgi:hypothetical protein